MNHEKPDQRISLVNREKRWKREKEAYDLRKASGKNASWEGKGQFKDHSGKRFGRLIAVRVSHRSQRGLIHWQCRCDCGQTVCVYSAHLVHGRTRSCGCYMLDRIREANSTHGKSRTPTWIKWAAMRDRCRNKNNECYKHYGGKGIRVCKRWNRFENFLADMGEVPSGLELDRFPNRNGNYEPGNCRWANDEEQSRNRDVCRTLTLNGVTRLLVEWAELLKIPSKRIHKRLSLGWNDKDALLKAPKKMRHA